MNGNQQPRRNNKNPAASAKGKGNSRGGRKRGNKKKTPRSAIDPKRPMWENKAGEAELAAIVGSVRPARNPSALVRSLGDPPLGKYASTAHHYYDAVYGKAQHFAIAIATANGLLVMDGVAGMLPCKTTLSPAEFRKLLRMALRPSVLTLLFKR